MSRKVYQNGSTVPEIMQIRSATFPAQLFLMQVWLKGGRKSVGVPAFLQIGWLSAHHVQQFQPPVQRPQPHVGTVPDFGRRKTFLCLVGKYSCLWCSIQMYNMVIKSCEVVHQVWRIKSRGMLERRPRDEKKNWNGLTAVNVAEGSVSCIWT